MSVKLITGCIGSGKTRYCIDRIRKLHTSDSSQKCIVLVPSHYTHETERMLITEFGGTGLNNIECTSFEKLSRELVNTSDERLNAIGRGVIISHAIKLALDEFETGDYKISNRLIRAVKKQGFVDVVNSFISELHRYSVTAQMLENEAGSTQSDNLSQKLTVMSVICKYYEKLRSDAGYIDSDEDLLRLAGVIKHTFDGSEHIFIDKFDELLPQQFEVLKALVDVGADITITFNTCADTSDTYYGTTNAINSILNYTSVQTLHLDGGMEHIKNAPDLKFLFDSWFDRDVYEKEVHNAEIFIARDAYTEAEHISSKILDLVRENGYRFRDISILCSDTSEYSHILEAIFDEYEIPYYSDERIAISEYPIVMQILALFDIIENDWDYSSVFEYLRAGFVYTKQKGRYIRLDSNKLDKLENFVLKYNIEHRFAWQRSWLDRNYSIMDTALGKTPTSDKLNTDELEALRLEIITPIISYSEAVDKAETVSDYCHALFEFLENINLYKGLKSELLSMAINHATTDAQRFGQIWNLILDTLNQVHTALGDKKVSHEEFCTYIRTAMSQCQIRTIPSGIDRVFIGSEDMNRAFATKVIFVIGAVSGTFPKLSQDEGFLSNADRVTLAENAVVLAPTTIKKADKQRNIVYKLLSAVTDKLYISYPSMTSDGASCLPSQTVRDIMDKLPKIRVTDDLSENDDTMLYVSSPKVTMHRRLISPNEHPLWKHVDSWFSEHDIWQSKIVSVEKSKRQFSRRRITLRPEIAKTLFDGEIRYSATRLNSYANCPFSHYLKYGLGVREREEYEMNAADTGTYAHEIIHRFCEVIDNDPALDWDSVSDEKCSELVSEIVSETIDKVNTSTLSNKENVADILRRMGSTVEQAAKTVCKSISCGEFTTDAYEKEINVDIAENIKVCGVIDRLDVCRHDGVNEYRIIDYKTGSKDFKVSEIYHGLDMQPVIYALAMRMLDKDAVISGMYYSMVHNNFAHIGTTSHEATAMTSLKKNTAYNGISFVGYDEKSAIPPEELDRIESELSRAERGLFLKGANGEVRYSKNLKTRPQSELLMGMVKDKIIETDSDIRNGNIAISPLSHGSKNACTYCEYSSICRFDEALKNPRIITEQDKEIWEMLEEDA